MNSEDLLHIVPTNRLMHDMTKEERKNLVENLIQGALDQIRKENREPTKWESDCLQSAMAALLFHQYFLALHHIDSATKEAWEVSRSDEWFQESEEHTIFSLEKMFKKLKAFNSSLSDL